MLPTHLGDCAAQLKRIHARYVHKFLRALSIFSSTVTFDDDSGAMMLSSSDSNMLLIVSVACENAIVGTMHGKLWPAIVQSCEKRDSQLTLKCRQLAQRLRLDAGGSQASEAAASFFQINPAYFQLNSALVLKELRRVEMLNTPFEKLECLKHTIELITSELALSAKNNKSYAAAATTSPLTSDTLVPLLAFVLVKSQLKSLHAIMLFVEMFHFSAQLAALTNSTVLAELSFFLTSFRAAVQLVEEASLH